MASLGDMMSFLNEDEHVQRFLCPKHERCLVDQHELTPEFRKKHCSVYYGQETVVSLEIFGMKHQLRYSDKFVNLKRMDGKSEDTYCSNVMEVTFKMGANYVAEMKPTDQNHWQCVSPNLSLKPEVRTKTRSDLIIEVHYHCPTAYMYPRANAAAKRHESKLRNQKDCDVHFDLPNNESVGAHVSVLSMHSPVFEAMFVHDTKESRTKRITIEDASAEMFKTFLIYLYTGKLAKGLSLENYKDLVAIGHKYQMPDMLDVLASQMGCMVTSKTVVGLLELADRYTCSQLMERCLRYIKDFAKDVTGLPNWLDFTKESPELCTIAVRRITGADESSV